MCSYCRGRRRFRFRRLPGHAGYRSGSQAGKRHPHESNTGRPACTIPEGPPGMNRRYFMRSAGALSAGFVLPASHLRAEGPSDRWRTFEVKTRVEILNSSGPARVWIPAALIAKTPFQRTLSNTFSAPGGTARIVHGKVDGSGIVAAEFPDG